MSDPRDISFPAWLIATVALGLVLWYAPGIVFLGLLLEPGRFPRLNLKEGVRRVIEFLD